MTLQQCGAVLWPVQLPSRHAYHAIRYAAGPTCYMTHKEFEPEPADQVRAYAPYAVFVVIATVYDLWTALKWTRRASL